MFLHNSSYGKAYGYDVGRFLDSSIETEYQGWKANILSNIDTMDTLPSFDGNEITINIGETYTLTDTNGRLQHYPSVDVTENGIRFEHVSGSNDLKITATDNCNAESYTFFSRKCGLNLQYGGSTQLVYLFREAYQKNLYTNGYGSDPSFYLDLKINLTGKLELTKLNTNGDLVNGSKFRVWSNDTGYDEVVTVTNGRIVIEHLKPGTYFLKENSVGGKEYVLNTETYSVEIKTNETASKTVVNDEPTRNNYYRKEKCEW